MPDEVRRLYWDSCVFLSYVDGNADRAPTLEAILEEARQGKVEIVTSTASVTEVAFGSVEMDRRALDPEIQALIEGFWVPDSPVRLAEVSVLVVEGARDLMRTAIPAGTKVPKPMDAIHVATALRLKVNEFHTYDEPLLKIARRAGLTSAVPNTPSPPLPMEYRERASDGD